MQLYVANDRFDNFPLTAGKIQVRITDKGSVVQPNDERGETRSVGGCFITKCTTEKKMPAMSTKMAIQE